MSRPATLPLRALESRHRHLARLNHDRLKPELPSASWQFEYDRECEVRALEVALVENERRVLAPQLEDVPSAPDAFMAWFEQLRATGPGQGDPLFEWLGNEATLEQMRWFLRQEAAGEAGFDDLVALTQVRFPPRAKLELARNYWDEMGRGHLDGMHGRMLERTVELLDLKPSIDDTVWEALALSNTMIALASNRHYAFHSIGALGVIEMTAPGRVAQVNAGLRRLGAPAEARQYFQLHAGLDVRHSEAWNREVIRPLVEARPDVAVAIAEGAILRLHCGARTFARYRKELKAGAPPAAPRKPVRNAPSAPALRGRAA